MCILKKKIIYKLNLLFKTLLIKKNQLFNLLVSIDFAVFSVKVVTAVYLVPPNSVLSLAVPCTAFDFQHQIEFDVISIAIPYSG